MNWYKQSQVSKAPIILRVFESPNGKVFWIAMAGERRAGAGIGDAPVEVLAEKTKRMFPNIQDVQPMDMEFMLDHFPPSLMKSCPVMGPRAGEAQQRQQVA